jgi:hypothetical protein
MQQSSREEEPGLQEEHVALLDSVLAQRDQGDGENVKILYRLL